MATEIVFENFIKDSKIAASYSLAIKNILSEILEKGYPFSVITNLPFVSFEPTLPSEIEGLLNEITLFTLDGYTLSSAYIEDDILSFEAGFGSENFGSVCTVYYHAIFQVSLDNSILFINPSATVEKYFKLDNIDKEQKERSMNAFKLNKKRK